MYIWLAMHGEAPLGAERAPGGRGHGRDRTAGRLRGQLRRRRRRRRPGRLHVLARGCPAPMWKLATAPDSLNRSHIGSKYGSGSSGSPSISGLSESVNPRDAPVEEAGHLLDGEVHVPDRQHRLGEQPAARLLLQSRPGSRCRSAGRQALGFVLDGEDVVRREPDAVRVEDLGPDAHLVQQREALLRPTRPPGRSSSNGCTMCVPRTFLRPVPIVLPPMLAQHLAVEVPRRLAVHGPLHGHPVLQRRRHPRGPEVGRFGEVRVAVDDPYVLEGVRPGAHRFNVIMRRDSVPR